MQQWLFSPQIYTHTFIFLLPRTAQPPCIQCWTPITQIHSLYELNFSFVEHLFRFQWHSTHPPHWSCWTGEKQTHAHCHQNYLFISTSWPESGEHINITDAITTLVLLKQHSQKLCTAAIEKLTLKSTLPAFSFFFKPIIGCMIKSMDKSANNCRQRTSGQLERTGSQAGRQTNRKAS